MLVVTLQVKQHGRLSFLCKVLNLSVNGGADQQKSYRVVVRSFR